MITMFRLKALEIYMGPETTTVEQIQAKLLRLRSYQILFAVVFSIGLAFEFLLHVGVNQDHYSDFMVLP